MLEAQLEAIFRDAVRKAGGRTEKVAPTNAGMPDRLVLWPWGIVRLVELKTETGALRPAQRVWISRAADLGIEVPVLYGKADVVAWVSAERAQHQIEQA